MSIKKFILWIVCFVFLNLGNVYAVAYSEFSWTESETSSGSSIINNKVYFNQLMNLENVKVKFTQDNNNYIFHITGNSSVKIYKNVAVTTIHERESSVAPMLYKTDNFGDNMYIEESSKTPFFAYTGTVHSNSNVKIGDTVIEHFSESYRIMSDGSYKDFNQDGDGNGDKYFVPVSLRNLISARSYNFEGATSYPNRLKNNGIGVTLLQNSSSYSYSYNDVVRDGARCIDTCYFNINAKIAINKAYINNYRCVCFAQTYSLATNFIYKELSANIKGVSLCTQTIDLKEYIDCDHSWSIQSEGKTNHYRYCKNCEWKVTEPHKLLYEYDGIKDNVCACSYIDKVNYQFKINDDFTEEVTEVLYTDTEYTKHEFQNKTGHKFKHYNVYEKKFVSDTNLSTISNALKTVFVSTVSELPGRTGNTSLVFEAEYEANKFTIYYSNKNNKNLNLSENIEPQTIEYDEVAYLKKNINYLGYVFKGWSFVEGGESVDLAPLYEMTNYTATDGYELQLYPVYANLDFKIAYSAGSGHFKDGSKYKEINYTYYDDKELEKAISDVRDLYFYCYVDDVGNKFRTMADVKKYVEKNGVENFTLNLFPIFTRNPIGSAERTEGGGGPGEKFGRGEESEVEESITYDMLLNADDENLSYNHWPSIVPFSNSEISDGDEKNEASEKNLDGAVVASLSFIIKSDTISGNSHSKWDVLILFIKSNLPICILAGMGLLSLLIIYEIIVISSFRRSFRS